MLPLTWAFSGNNPAMARPKRRLAAARLAHQPDLFSRGNCQRDAVYRMHRALRQADVNAEVLDHQDGLASRPAARVSVTAFKFGPCRPLAGRRARHRRRRVTPSASLSPSPTRLNATTVTTMAIPAG